MDAPATEGGEAAPADASGASATGAGQSTDGASGGQPSGVAAPDRGPAQGTTSRFD